MAEGLKDLKNNTIHTSAMNKKQVLRKIYEQLMSKGKDEESIRIYDDSFSFLVERIKRNPQCHYLFLFTCQQMVVTLNQLAGKKFVIILLTSPMIDDPKTSTLSLPNAAPTQY